MKLSNVFRVFHKPIIFQTPAIETFYYKRISIDSININSAIRTSLVYLFFMNLTLMPVYVDIYSNYELLYTNLEGTR